MTNWFYPRGSLARDGYESVVDSSITGWQYTGLRVATVDPGRRLGLATGATERLVIPLAGSFRVDFTIGNAHHSQVLDGRASVLAGPTDVQYVPASSPLEITGSGRVAVAEAPTEEVRPARYLPAADVPVELRGAGTMSREVRNFGTPDTLDAARMIVCEVITPSGGWSSYPPHKHDTHIPGVESRLEEIYYFETSVMDGSPTPPEADPSALFVAYASDEREISLTETVRSGDIALVPYGYHGPAAATPGYDLYYLNVMAGPDPDRAWRITDDPAHSWVRGLWEGHDIDPRLPVGGDRT